MRTFGANAVPIKKDLSSLHSYESLPQLPGAASADNILERDEADILPILELIRFHSGCSDRGAT